LTLAWGRVRIRAETAMKQARPALNLFPQAAARPETMPLAARVRPRLLEEFVGQEATVGEGTWLRQAIESDALSSLIFYGPPGCGKSTLAAIIAARTAAHFESYSAVTSGVADIRRVTSQANQRRHVTGQRTILFVDEVHRFNKAQQDAFLPHVEAGTIIFIGATTENPYFEINSPLLSRSRVITFAPLSQEQVGLIVDRALADKERGLGRLSLSLTPEARDHLLNYANGDARAALNALEAASELARAAKGEITLPIAEQAIQRRALLYDDSGDSHYDTISAFIKSIRGSDPEAALYWLARMITAGEDPRFIARRLVIHAAEDVGNADPMALLVATAAAHSVEYVGLPEAQIPLAQATIYLAAAPKSNASMLAISRAMEDVSRRAAPPVPRHLRDTSYPGAKKLGHGEGYLYPHDFPGHFVPQDYLPPDAKERRYYEPSDQGVEREIARRLQAWERARREQGERKSP
jgi:putative ATPase